MFVIHQFVPRKVFLQVLPHRAFWPFATSTKARISQAKNGGQILEIVSRSKSLKGADVAHALSTIHRKYGGSWVLRDPRFAVLINETLQNSHKFSPSELADTAHSLSFLKYKDNELMNILAQNCVKCVNLKHLTSFQTILISLGHMGYPRRQMWELVDYSVAELFKTASRSKRLPISLFNVYAAGRIRPPKSFMEQLEETTKLCEGALKFTEYTDIVHNMSRLNLDSPLLPYISSHISKPKNSAHLHLSTGLQPEIARLAHGFASQQPEAETTIHFMENLIEIIHKRLTSWHPTFLCLVAWALAVTDTINCEKSHEILTHLLQTSDRVRSKIYLSQLHQVITFCKLKDPKLFLNILNNIPEGLDVEVLENRAKEAFLSNARESGVIVSGHQQALSNTLTSIGIQNELEVQVASGYSLDIAIKSLKIGIEYDGPEHFTIGSNTPRGKTVLKRRILELETLTNGWGLLNIPYFEFDGLSHEAKIEYLRWKLLKWNVDLMRN